MRILPRRRERARAVLAPLGGPQGCVGFHCRAVDTDPLALHQTPVSDKSQNPAEDLLMHLVRQAAARATLNPLSSQDDGILGRGSVRLRTVPSKVGIGTPQNHAGGGRERSGLQALYFLSDDAVALAGGRFETLVVENPDYALPVRDQTGGLEYAQGYGTARFRDSAWAPGAGGVVSPHSHFENFWAGPAALAPRSGGEGLGQHDRGPWRNSRPHGIRCASPRHRSSTSLAIGLRLEGPPRPWVGPVYRSEAPQWVQTRPCGLLVGASAYSLKASRQPQNRRCAGEIRLRGKFPPLLNAMAGGART